MANQEVKQPVLDWQAQVDMLGPFCRLEEMEKLLQSADDLTKDKQAYGFLEGLYFGRLIHEELGGLK